MNMHTKWQVLNLINIIMDKGVRTVQMKLTLEG